MDEVTVTNYKRCDVVKMTGRVDSNTAPKLADVMTKIIEAGRFKIIFDMTEVTFMSSKGWWVLIDTQKKCKRYRRGEVVLVNIKKEIRESLELVGMGTYFTVHFDLAAAVGGF